MTLTGWQRTWVVLSVLYSGPYLLLVLLVGEVRADNAPFMVLLVFGPPALLYALGLAVRWIWLGFRRPE